MTLFFSLLPLYLLGNIHCMGMCGPLVMLLGQHRFRLFYFIGRVTSFSLAGLMAGEAGAVVHHFFKHFYLSELISFLSGGAIVCFGCYKLFGRPFIQIRFNHPFIERIQQTIGTLMLKDRRWPTFLFGFFTVALPCGQTLLVFSACALVGDPLIGLGNGFAFALLTSPSLFLSMHAYPLLKKFKGYDRPILGLSSLVVGGLAICRGLAEAGWISHWVINPNASSNYHMVIF